MNGQSNMNGACNTRNVGSYTDIERIFQGYMYNRQTKEVIDCNWRVIGKVKHGKIYYTK